MFFYKSNSEINLYFLRDLFRRKYKLIFKSYLYKKRHK